MQNIKIYIKHLLLFGITLVTTTLAGAQWMNLQVFDFQSWGELWRGNFTFHADNFWKAHHYSLPFLFILTVHEFGHYFTARYYKLKVTLPFYMPLWLGNTGITIGTLGAYIRIKSPFPSRKSYFDVGIAGPLAGFVAALGVLFYGFTHLPPPEFIFTIHPEYQQYGLDYAHHVYQSLPPNTGLMMGTNLVFEFFKTYIADPERLPNPYEIMHYPYLMAGYWALFFTALNLIPIGQLDGGHILYGLIGAKKHRKVTFVLFLGFMTYSGLGLFSPQDDWEWLKWSPVYVWFLYVCFLKAVPHWKWSVLIAVSIFGIQFGISWLFPDAIGFQGWLIFGLILGRFLGIYHPVAPLEVPLDRKRQILGWLALIIFILCFTPFPVRVV